MRLNVTYTPRCPRCPPCPVHFSKSSRLSLSFSLTVFCDVLPNVSCLPRALSNVSSAVNKKTTKKEKTTADRQRPRLLSGVYFSAPRCLFSLEECVCGWVVCVCLSFSQNANYDKVGESGSRNQNRIEAIDWANANVEIVNNFQLISIWFSTQANRGGHLGFAWSIICGDTDTTTWSGLSRQSSSFQAWKQSQVQWGEIA